MDNSIYQSVLKYLSTASDEEYARIIAEVSELRNIEWEDIDKLLYVGGSTTPYRCECGGNVFRSQVNGPRVKCNSCQGVYISEG